MTTSTREKSVSVALVAALDRAWGAIQRRHPDVPGVVITLGSGTLGTKSKAGELTLGHFAAGRWQHADAAVPELFVGGEGLRRSARDVFGTLLHEAAHGLAATREIKDTSRQGRFHNGRYRALAEELGLDVAQTGSIGWSATTLPDVTAARYRREIDAVAAALVAYRHGEPQRAKGTQKNKNGTVARCGCPDPRQFRITVSVLALGPIVCGLCGQEFVGDPVEDDEQDEG